MGKSCTQPRVRRIEIEQPERFAFQTSVAAAPRQSRYSRSQIANSPARVYPSQQVTSDGLGHAAGGTWAFYDAATDDGAPFTFGVPAGPSAPGKDPEFGELVLATSNRARFVAALAKAFGQKVPISATSARKGQPMKVAVAVLGQNLKSQPDGSYGEGGTATATKLFFEVGE
jgi:hypothetical protein